MVLPKLAMQYFIIHSNWDNKRNTIKTLLGNADIETCRDVYILLYGTRKRTGASFTAKTKMANKYSEERDLELCQIYFEMQKIIKFT